MGNFNFYKANGMRKRFQTFNWNYDLLSLISKLDQCHHYHLKNQVLNPLTQYFLTPIFQTGRVLGSTKNLPNKYNGKYIKM